MATQFVMLSEDELRGCVTPWHPDEDVPVILTIDGKSFVALFRSEEELRSVMRICKVSDSDYVVMTCHRPSGIYDTAQRTNVHVCVDLRVVQGRFQYCELKGYSEARVQ